jgi:hypothetical protein
MLAIIRERRKEKAREGRTALYAPISISSTLEACINRIVNRRRSRLEGEVSYIAFAYKQGYITPSIFLTLKTLA